MTFSPSGSTDDHAGHGYGDQPGVQSSNVPSHEPPNQPSTHSLQHPAAQPLPRHPAQSLRQHPAESLCPPSSIHIHESSDEPSPGRRLHLCQHHPRWPGGAA